MGNKNMLLSLNNVSFGYDTHDVICDVSFKIDEGEFLGIIGPNGSGKTTLLKILAGKIKPDQGQVTLQNRSIRQYPEIDIAKWISWVPQETFSVFSFSVEEIVRMGRFPHFVGSIYETTHDLDVVKRIMEQLNIWDIRHSVYNELSMGERQRVIVGRALAQETSIMLLDEPTSNLDMGYQHNIMNIFLSLNRDLSKTIVCVSHDVNLVSLYCTKIIVLKDGCVMAHGKPEDILCESILENAYGIKVQVHTDPKNHKKFITCQPAVNA